MRSLVAVCFFRALVVSFGLLAGAVVAEPADAESTPVFAIDSVAHAGTASRIAVTPDERRFVTVSHDKTLRVWDVATGQMLRRLVIPVNRSNDGEMMALALSPDAEYAAVAGYLRAFGKDKAVVIVSLRDGSIRRALPGWSSVIWALAWSPDGRYLALGLGDDGAGRGVRIVETSSWKIVFEDRKVEGRVSSVGFQADNTLFATTFNQPDPSSVYLYKSNGGSFSRVAVQSFGKKSGLRAYWSHDGKNIYVDGHGYYDGDTLRELPHPAHARRRSGGPLPMMGARETPDGRSLFAMARQRHETIGKVWRWTLPSSGSFDALEIPDPRVMDFVALKDGTLGYVADNGVVAAIGPDFRPKWRNERQIAAIENRPERLRVSADEQWISLPVMQGGKLLDIAFNLSDPRFVVADAANVRWREPDTGRRSMRLLTWQGTREPTVNDVRFPMRKERERSLSVAVHSTEDAFVFGTTGFQLRKSNARGEALWSRYLGSDVSAVNLLESRGLVVAATADGFVHLLRWSDGQPVVSVYLEPGSRKWIAVSPEGRYEAGIGAEDLGGWIVTSGKDRVADLFPLSRFRQTRLQPGLVRQVIEAGTKGVTHEPAPAVVVDADSEAPPLATVAVDRLPPAVDILSPGFDVVASASRLKIRYRVRTAADAPVTSVAARVVSASQATRGLMPKPTAPDGDELEVDLPAEDAEVQIVAENRWGASVPTSIKVRWQGEPPKSVAKKGVLHLVAIGVSDYDNPDYKLGFAAKDAQDFVGLVRTQEGRAYSSVKLHVLTDRQAAKGAIESVFADLRGAVGPGDTTMVFLAGHGINDATGEYLYLPRDASLDRLQATGLSFGKLGNLLASLPGRTVMFLDTCHSGNVIGKLRDGQRQNHTAAVNELASSEKNIVVFASSTGGQLSLEDVRWGNGAFTKALLEGLAGKADLLKRGRVTYKQLDAYVSDRVDELTEGKQTPVTPVLQGVPDFTLAEIRK